MENLFYFEHEDFGMARVVILDSEPYFVAKDVTEILGFSKTSRALETHVKAENKRYTPIKNLSGSAQVMTVINGRGFCELVAASKLPNKNVFKKWLLLGGFIKAHQPMSNFRVPRSYDEAIWMLVYEIEQKELMRKQRDDAIFKKDLFSDEEADCEDDEYSPYPQYASVQQVMEATGKLYDEQPLKDYCKAHGLEYMSVPTKNGKVVSDIDLEEDYDSSEDF